jgi:thiosulfate dehydrogenase
LKLRNFLLGALCGGILPALAVTVWLCLGFASVRADVSPPAWESRLMRHAVRASVRRQSADVRNPLPATDDDLIAGAKLYLDDCVGCHGGLDKSSRFGAGFYPPAPQFAFNATPYSVPELFWIAKYGLRHTGMGAQGQSYSDDEVWKLSMFIQQAAALPPSVRQAVQPAGIK